MNSAIPDIDRCLELMEQFGMWENIRHHCFLVARVAELLQQRLTGGAQDTANMQRELVVAGGLLHDIAKSKCLEEGCLHAETGAAICGQLGYPEVAEIVANHVILSDFSPDRYTRGEFNATELVFYADKRVKHDQLVSLDERLAYILEKYSHDNQRREALILQNFQACRTLERHLFTCLDLSPDDLGTLLAGSPAGRLRYPPAGAQS